MEEHNASTGHGITWRRIRGRSQPTYQFNISKQRNNKPWGDELIEKQRGIFRVYGLNVNGISMDARGGQMDNVCRLQRETQADVLCSQDHKLDNTKATVREKLIKVIRQHFPRSRQTFSTTRIPFTHEYKPGGTFLLDTGQHVGRVVRQDKDKWGRWSSQTYRGRGNNLFERK